MKFDMKDLKSFYVRNIVNSLRVSRNISIANANIPQSKEHKEKKSAFICSDIIFLHSILENQIKNIKI